MAIYVTFDQIKKSSPPDDMVEALLSADISTRRSFPLALVVKHLGFHDALWVIRHALPKDFPYHRFARETALKVAPLWKAPPVVIRYLVTADDRLRVEAWNAAHRAARYPSNESASFAARAAKEACAAVDASNAPYVAADASSFAAYAAANDAGYADDGTPIWHTCMRYLSHILNEFNPEEQEHSVLHHEFDRETTTEECTGADVVALSKHRVHINIMQNSREVGIHLPASVAHHLAHQILDCTIWLEPTTTEQRQRYLHWLTRGRRRQLELIERLNDVIHNFQ